MNVFHGSLLAFATSAVTAPVIAQKAAQLEPPAPISAQFLIDTDGDGRDELVVVSRTGVLTSHGVSADGTFSLRSTLQLVDPTHTLLGPADVLPGPGIELVLADSSGTSALSLATAEPKLQPLLRRARCTMSLGRPLASPFAQDLNRDGRIDVLLPTPQGVQPFLQQAPGADGMPQFQAMPLLPGRPQISLVDRNGGGDPELQGGITVPPVDTQDLNGDGRPDLLTTEGKRHDYHLQGADGAFAPPIQIDIGQFQDSTPKATVELGSTAVLGDDQLLQSGDIDGDGIPDFVIAHRRKVWTFLSSKAGPQFTKAHTQAVADDTTAMLVVDLDEDKRADLLTFQVQIPSAGSLLLGLVQSIDIDVKAVGHRADNGVFAGTPAWRRTVTLRIPPLLSLLSKQQELVKRFTDIVGKARLGVRGAFTGPGKQDLALLRTERTHVDLYAMQGDAPTLGSVAGRRQLRRLLFDDPDPLFTLDRLFTLLGGFLDEMSGNLIGERTPFASVPLRDPAQWRLHDLLVGELDGAPGAELLAVYERIADGTVLADATPMRAYDQLPFAPPAAK